MHVGSASLRFCHRFGLIPSDALSDDWKGAATLPGYVSTAKNWPTILPFRLHWPSFGVSLCKFSGCGQLLKRRHSRLQPAENEITYAGEHSGQYSDHGCESEPGNLQPELRAEFSRFSVRYVAQR